MSTWVGYNHVFSLLFRMHVCIMLWLTRIIFLFSLFVFKSYVTSCYFYMPNSVRNTLTSKQRFTDRMIVVTDPKAFLSIIRPQNCVIGGLTVIAGLLMTFRMNPVGVVSGYYYSLLLAYMTYFFVAAGGNVVNDIFDIEVDRVNRPHRPLPSGRITVRQAWLYVVVLGVMGTILAFLNGFYGMVLVLIFLFVGYAYAAKGKTLGPAGNFMVAFSFAFGVIYGAFVYAERVSIFEIPLPVWFFFITAFMILQAREVIKGAEDVEGDRLRDVRTIARVYGNRTAVIVAAVFNLIGIICYTLLWILNYASLSLWFLLIVGDALVFGAVITPLTGPNNKRRLAMGSTFDKLGALVGLVAFVLISIV